MQILKINQIYLNNLTVLQTWPFLKIHRSKINTKITYLKIGLTFDQNNIF